jgi:hypothetical protein
MHAQPPGATAMHSGVFVLLTLLVPFAAAYLHDLGSTAWRRQCQEYRTQYTGWEHEAKQQRRVVWGYDEQRRRLDDRESGFERKLHTALQAQHTAAQASTQTERLQRAALHAIMVALATDRYYYLQALGKPGLAPQHQRQPEMPILVGVNGMGAGS